MYGIVSRSYPAIPTFKTIHRTTYTVNIIITILDHNTRLTQSVAERPLAEVGSHITPVTSHHYVPIIHPRHINIIKLMTALPIVASTITIVQR